MTLRSIGGYAATALLSSAAGWMMNAPAPAPASVVKPVPAVSVAAVSNRPSMPLDAAPMIAVSSDGNVTLRVEQQPLEWVLEQIASQSGWSDVRQRAGTTAAPLARSIAAPTPEVCTDPSTLTPAQEAQLLQTIEHGSEVDRFDGLMVARSAGISVPAPLLKVFFETNASERVRMLAFESYLDQLDGGDDEMRRALEAAMYVPNVAIQREAKLRLDELLESERLEVAGEQKAEP